MKKFFYGAFAIAAICAAVAVVFTAAPVSADVMHLSAGAFEIARVSAFDLTGLAIGIGMTTLARDAQRSYELGEQNDVPVIAADIIYESAAVGDNASGYARPLVAGDQFLGFALQRADNAAGSPGDINVRVRSKGRVELTVSGVALTDVGKAVYASDDNAFTLTASGNSYIGRVVRYVTTDTCIVAFDAERGALANSPLAAVGFLPGLNTGGTHTGTCTGTQVGTDQGNLINALIFQVNRLTQMLTD